MQIRKAFKYRIYPTDEQKTELARQFGHSRFVYNHYRRVREEFYQETGSGLTYNDCAIDLSERLKVDFPWLKEADSQVLQQKLKDLDKAYQNFFAGRADYPKFRRKHDGQSIRYPQRFKLQGSKIYLPKVGWVKVKRHRRIEGEMKNCTVTRTKTGKHFVSIQCEMEIDTPDQKDSSVGLDLGLKDFVTAHSDDKIVRIASSKPLRKMENLLKIRQRRVSRKVKGVTGERKQKLVWSLRMRRSQIAEKTFTTS